MTKRKSTGNNFRWIDLLFAFRLNINPWFYQGWVRKALAYKNPRVTLVKVWRPHHEAEQGGF